MDKPKYFSVLDNVLFPDQIPWGGEKIKLDSFEHRPFRSIPVGENWQLHQKVQLFDVFCFTLYDTEELVFQILPTGDPKFGRFVLVKRSNLINNLSGNRRAFWDHLDAR